MPHILANENLQLYLDLPDENYRSSRFDHTGKITLVKYKNIAISTSERSSADADHIYGKGFYNEFGINQALGFTEAKMGDWFHKIGVGLLRKDGEQYLFNHNYEVQPAQFTFSTETDQANLSCIGPLTNGYAYVLKKSIRLMEDGFSLHYYLENTGVEDIITSEYTHNFIGIGEDQLGPNYSLKFPARINSSAFEEVVNPDNKVIIGKNAVKFSGEHRQPFFVSHVFGNKSVTSYWQIINHQCKIAISETGSFKTSKVNLWGWQHVISPELFMHLSLKPSQSAAWTRTYRIHDTG